MVTYTKKVSIKGDFAKKGIEIKDGDIITMLDEGRTVDGNYGAQHIFKVKLADGETERDFSLNQTSLNNLIDAFGEEASEWIGKKAKVWAILSNVQGKMIKVYYLSHPIADLDEGGQFVMTVNADDGIPVVNDDPGQTEGDVPEEEKADGELEE